MTRLERTAKMVPRDGQPSLEFDNFSEKLEVMYLREEIGSGSVLEALHRLSWEHDHMTATHTLCVAHLAAVIAESAGVSRTECDLILYAAPLHDIGKIRVPIEIINKPGRLTEEEWVIMRRHPHAGYEMLSCCEGDIIERAKEIALYHHENWDGSGYPFGLVGSDIPLHAQIVAMADVYDALMSRRSYKEAWQHAEVLTEIERLSGKKFDPGLVRQFVSVRDLVRKVKSFWNARELRYHS